MTSENILQEFTALEDPKNSRLTILPINPQFEIFWNLYKKQLESFWQASEIDFSGDLRDFLSLSDDEKNFVRMILAFFAASDGIVNFNIQERFMNEIQIQEAHNFVCIRSAPFWDFSHRAVCTFKHALMDSSQKRRSQTLYAVNDLSQIFKTLLASLF